MRKIYEKDKFFVYEQPPTKRTVVVDGKRYFLSFPYVIFCINTADILFVYASYNSIKNRDDFFYYLPLPNVSIGGYVCFGKEKPKILDLKKIIDYFWNSSFDSNAFLTPWNSNSWKEGEELFLTYPQKFEELFPNIKDYLYN